MILCAAAAVTGLLVTGVATGWVRRVALRKQMLDIPNARSSHAEPTPRGGGVAIVLVVSSALVAMGSVGAIPAETALALLLGGLAVACVGFLDDRWQLSASVRLCVHLAAGGWVVLCLSYGESIEWTQWSVHPILMSIGAVLWIAWSTNLYNFMDGIDGLAGVEAVSVGFGACAILFIASDSALWFLLAMIASATLGFLPWNWSPAKIFMGDVGSGFLGFQFGAVSVVSTAQGVLPLWVWPILLGVFVIDASLTLVRRWSRGEKVTEAHRAHAYQHAATRFGSHKVVSGTVAAINLAWLLPLGFLASKRPELGPFLALTAWLPLLGLGFLLKAGISDERCVPG